MAKQLQLTNEQKLQQLKDLAWGYAVDKMEEVLALNLKDEQGNALFTLKKGELKKDVSKQGSVNTLKTSIDDFANKIKTDGKNAKLTALISHISLAHDLLSALPEQESLKNDGTDFENFAGTYNNAKQNLALLQDSRTKTFLKAVAVILMALTVVLSPVAVMVARGMWQQRKDSKAFAEMNKVAHAQNPTASIEETQTGDKNKQNEEQQEEHKEERRNSLTA